MGLFITLEGPDGSGKTTQARLLAAWLVEMGHDVISTREPGGTRLGDVVRDLLLAPASRGMYPETEFLLFSAARAQHVREVIRPHLERGGTVVCDRFGDSSLAYQGYGRQLDLDTLRMITAFATGDLLPDLTVCLDLPVVEGLRRKQGAAQAEWNRMEEEQLQFHERVRQGFRALAMADPERWLVVDARLPIPEIQERIRARVSDCLERG